MAIIRTQDFSDDKETPKEMPKVFSAHSLLVLSAEKWMRNTLGCRVTLREFDAYTSNGEIPDVIGWVNRRCILTEVKASRSDFLSDKKKRFRRPDMPALGHWRFYFTVPNIIKPEELPAGWGLYELWHSKRVYYKAGIKYRNAEQPPLNSNRNDEVAILVSALRRLEIRGVLEQVYERD